jgi:hypothetical protein
MIRRFFLKLELHRNLAKRKAARPARREAAERAYSAQIKRRVAKCREVFG